MDDIGRIAVARYKRRRQLRIDAKAEDLDWITLENGEHAPIDSNTGDILGGPLKGRSFKDAKSVKHTPKSAVSAGRKKYDDYVKKVRPLKDRFSKIESELDEKRTKYIELFHEGKLTPELKSSMDAEISALESEYSSTKDTIEQLDKDVFSSEAFQENANAIKALIGENKKVDLSGVDFDQQVAIVDSVKTVINKYPSMKDAFSGITVEGVGDVFAQHSTFIAAFNPSTGLIHLNTDYYGIGKVESAREEYNKAREKKFHPEGVGFESSVVHEMGHALDTFLSKELFGMDYYWKSERISRRIWNTDIKAMKKAKGGASVMKSDIANVLCGYASESPDEYLAEGFAEYICSSTPRKTATKIGHRIEQYIKKYENKGY